MTDRLVVPGSDRSLVPLGAWNVAGWLILGVYAIAFTAAIFRVTGASAYGIWVTVATLRGVLVFVDAGITFGAARETARAGAPWGDRLDAYRWIAVTLALAALAFGVAGAGVPATILGLDGADADAARLVTVAFALEAALALAASPLAAHLRGRERFELLAAAAAAQAAAGLGVVAVALAPTGLAGAAAGLLAGRVAYVVAVAAAARAVGGARPTPLARPSRAAIRSALAFSAPVWLLALGGQLAVATDVPIAGFFFGPLAAAGFALGAAPPALASGLLNVALDVAYPRLAASARRDTARIVHALSLFAAGLGGLGFGVLALHGEEILLAWVGAAPPLGVSVLAVYCAAWALNVPAHLLAIAAIARAEHAVLVPVVLAEAAANVALSVALAAAIGPLGPAVATLVTLALSNVLVVPLVLLPRLGVSGARLLARSVSGGLIGLALALAIRWTTGALALDPLPAVLVAAALVALFAGPLLMLLHVLERAASIAARGGIGTWLRQRREVRAARAAIARMPRPSWDGDPPLVTVRIATYDRGAIVADRAIRSALAQTYPNIEVVVVGDRCDAATEHAVRSVADPRVRFENLAERGRYPAEPDRRWQVAGTVPMNRALDLARGEWIAPLDDDDEFTPDHVEVLLRACRERDLDVAYGVAECETAAGTWQPVGAWPPRHGAIIHASVLYRAGLPLRHDIESWRVDEPGDWNLWRRLRDAGARFGFVDRVVTRHYVERRHQA